MNSLRKGHNFERQISHKFSEWWGEEIRRVPMSGGSGIGSLNSDLVSTTEHTNPFPFSVECKKYKSLSLFDMLTKEERSLFYQWWEQAVREGEKDKKIPIVVFASNFTTPFIIMKREEFSSLDLWACKGRQQDKLPIKYLTRFDYHYCKGNGQLINLVITPLCGFLELIQPKYIKQYFDDMTKIQ